MALSQDIVQQFAKTVTPKEEPKEATYNATYKSIGGKDYVQIDGSEILTPVKTTVVAEEDDRVKVMIKEHTATIIGNITSPSARSTDLNNLKDTVDEQGNTIQQMDNTIIQQGNSIIQLNNSINQQGNTINQHNTIINQHSDQIASMNNTILAHDNAIELANNSIAVQGGRIDSLNDTVTSQGNSITAMNNTIQQHGNNIVQMNNTIQQQGNTIVEQGSSITILNSGFVIKDGVITGLDSAIVNSLKTNYLNAAYAQIDFSNIQMAAVEKLFTQSGIIKDLIVEGGKITGELVGVTLKGDLIEGNTIKADKLVVQGSDGLYYKLNISGETVETEQTEYNSLDGSVITAKSITASKIQVTDLVAFGATIGGFDINQGSINTHTKSSISSDVNGLYLGSDGQIYVGDLNNHIKYYKNSSNQWVLDIRASELRLGISSKTVNEELAETKEAAETAETNASSALTKANNSIKSETMHYLATSLSSGVTKNTPGWTTSTQTMTETNKYLWTYITYTKQDDTTTDTTPIISGVYGNAGTPGPKGDQGEKGDKGDKGDTGATGAQGPQGQTGAQGPKGDDGEKGDKGDKGDTGNAGNGIVNIQYFYAKSTSQTAPSASSITSLTIPELDPTNKYLWQKEIINYTSSASQTTVSLIAVYGNTGQTGAQGPKGDDGEKGDKGDKGDTGATGAQGPAGEDAAIKSDLPLLDHTKLWFNTQDNNIYYWDFDEESSTYQSWVPMVDYSQEFRDLNNNVAEAVSYSEELVNALNNSIQDNYYTKQEFDQQIIATRSSIDETFSQRIITATANGETAYSKIIDLESHIVRGQDEITGKPYIELSTGDNSGFSLRIENDSIKIKQAGHDVSTWLSDKFDVSTVITKMLGLGKFAFIINQDDSISFRKVQ